MKRETVPVSILYSTTGAYASLGRDAVAGAMAAISEVNADTRFSFRIEPKIDDPAGRAERYALLCEAAIRQHGCRHVIGTITSWSRKDVLPAIERHGALLWYAFPYEGYEASDSAIYLGACPNQHLLPLFDHVLPRYGRRPFIVGSNYIWGWEISRIAREITEGAGGQVVSERFVPLGSTEVDHLIAEIAQKRPDFILSNLVGESVTAFLAAYDSLRRVTPDAPPVVACNLSETELEGLTPSARSGHMSAAPYFNRLDSAENRDFKARMALRHGSDRRLTTSFVAAYMSVSILARAIEDAATDAPEAIRRIVTSRLFETPLGPITVDPRTHHAALRPHLALSNSDGEFDIFHSAPAPVAADPYLVRSLGRPLGGGGADADPAAPLAGSMLKVIK
ncbi:transporter substrate-binding protein [Rhizobium sp. CG5]|uniref:transporter substrate-binding domain-containing protein n=1 Tax=Rhizobium sp. CG5 TaxID=2726076 RepID=UPI002033E2B3|nr:transporter substrate-binding domain-containing protein [Rhizobium sp. CG5]MCM2472346.1 transporter substrate-binding protein [Rhizobium sp. CG5]